LSEIDRWVKAAEERNPEELDIWAKNDFPEHLDSLKKVVEETDERNKKIKEDEQIGPLIKIAYNFLSDSKEDGLIEADAKLGSQNTKKTYQAAQSRESSFKNLNSIEDKDYKKAFDAFKKFYATNYELFISTNLMPIYKKQFGREYSKGTVLKHFKEYRDGKYAPLFAILIPQIRNSIDHEDSLIDHKQPFITFYDRAKPPLKISLEECKVIHYGIFNLTIAFDIAIFELKKSLIKEMAEAAAKVKAFLEKHKLKIAKGKGINMSIFEMGKRLEERGF